MTGESGQKPAQLNMLRIDAEEGANEQMTPSCGLYEKAKKQCVGILDDEAVYFVGTRTSFHLAVECSPGQFRRLSETEHLRFRRQSRIEGLCYGQY
jgi:hypothetical protein